MGYLVRAYYVLSIVCLEGENELITGNNVKYLLLFTDTLTCSNGLMFTTPLKGISSRLSAWSFQFQKQFSEAKGMEGKHENHTVDYPLFV